MELKDFVSETLLAIIIGVTDAQKKAIEHGALVNPSGLMRNSANVLNNSIWDNSTNNYAQQVSFDIAVTTEDAAQAGAKVKVLSVFGAEIGGTNKNAVASRVQFTVPILLPGHDIGNPKARGGVSLKD